MSVKSVGHRFWHPTMLDQSPRKLIHQLSIYVNDATGFAHVFERHNDRSGSVPLIETYAACICSQLSLTQIHLELKSHLKHSLGPHTYPLFGLRLGCIHLQTELKKKTNSVHQIHPLQLNWVQRSGKEHHPQGDSMKGGHSQMARQRPQRSTLEPLQLSEGRQETLQNPQLKALLKARSALQPHSDGLQPRSASRPPTHGRSWNNPFLHTRKILEQSFSTMSEIDITPFFPS